MASLLIAVPGGAVAGRAAEVLELHLDGLRIPIRLDQLEAWSRRPSLRSPATADASPSEQELAVWLELMEPEGRRSLAELLRAPLLRDRGFGRQLLDSWAGAPMLAEVGTLLTTPDGRSTTSLLQSSLRRLLEERRAVTALDLLRALPPQQLSLQLDNLLVLAEQWRRQLDRQTVALQRLRRLPLPSRPSEPLPQGDGTVSGPRRVSLAVAHRREPLPLDLWLPAATTRARPWVLMMPGLGGDASHLGWLAEALARQGWSVVVLQHPGSDAAAMRQALEGRRPPPGAEVLPTRQADAEAVLAAQHSGALPVRGRGVVLVGHSLGGVTALLAAGLRPEPGLAERCRRALRRLPIANPSRLLQCQLAEGPLPKASPRLPDLRGVVLLNSFGSLLWARRALAPLGVPVLLIGGSLDLVTPPLEEQLDLFLPAADPRSRLVLLEGGSHFSAVRMSESEEALFRLGDDLVGVDPAVVQGVLLPLTEEFLGSLGRSGRTDALPAQRRRTGDVTAHVLDPAAARRWSGEVPR